MAECDRVHLDPGGDVKGPHVSDLIAPGYGHITPESRLRRGCKLAVCEGAVKNLRKRYDARSQAAAIKAGTIGA
jgi:hypothetical protein